MIERRITEQLLENGELSLSERDCLALTLPEHSTTINTGTATNAIAATDRVAIVVEIETKGLMAGTTATASGHGNSPARSTPAPAIAQHRTSVRR